MLSEFESLFSGNRHLGRRHFLHFVAASGWMALSHDSIHADTQLETENAVDRAIHRGVQWLLEQQGEDGGWRSDTYGAMRNGVGTTSLALWTLSKLSKADWDDADHAIRRGIPFLIARHDEKGFVAGIEGIADSPIYATALILLAVSQRPDLKSSIDCDRLSTALLNAQRNSRNGWRRDQPDFGGWGTISESGTLSDAKLPSTISVTAYVLAALVSQDHLTEEARSDAMHFLSRCQSQETDNNDGGGFYFTPHLDHPLNKGGMTDSRGSKSPRPYLSTTCDGLRAVQACWISTKDSSVTKAMSWLNRQELVFPIQRDDTILKGPIVRGLEYYSAASFAEIHTLQEADSRGQQRTAISQMLINSQTKVGSWQNTNSVMKEDDPLISTPLALSALIELRRPHKNS